MKTKTKTYFYKLFTQTSAETKNYLFTRVSQTGYTITVTQNSHCLVVYMFLKCSIYCKERMCNTNFKHHIYLERYSELV